MANASLRSISLSTLALAGMLATTAAAGEPDGRGGGSLVPPTDSISPETYGRIGAEIERNVALLGLGAVSTEGTPSFAWPLAANGVGYYSLHGISNFVDHDTGAPDLLDYDCGEHTYDGHRGIDIIPWPYPWKVMDEHLVKVVAAAPGTLIARFDGNFDRRCTCETDDPNYVIVQHADGSRAWYLHLKNGSLTSKLVGQSVTTGEILGTVGSSGCSTAVHLHFEVHDAGTAPGPLRDPFDGACNSLNASSLWLVQPPYRKPTIDYLSSNSAPPLIPACPTQETPNAKRLFASGQNVYLVVFLHDETPADAKDIVVRRPDGSVFFSTSHTTPSENKFSHWYWFWTGTSLTGGPTGRWSFEVTIDGTTRKRAFWVGAVFADDFEDANLGAWSAHVP